MGEDLSTDIGLIREDVRDRQIFAHLFDAGGALLSIYGLPLGVALGGVDVDVAPRVDGVRRTAESHWAQGEES